MIERKFELAAFCAHVKATAKECNALRQDVVRGLKDYYQATFGYDRYGAETIFMVPERMSEPYVFGFACRRVLHDRRISLQVKKATARLALTTVSYGADAGIPFALLGAFAFLAEQDALSPNHLRYGLVASAGESGPFQGLDKGEYRGFFRRLLGCSSVPAAERLFWGHSLVSRHGDGVGADDLLNTLLGHPDLPVEGRMELCNAWLHFRQPRLDVSIPPSDGGFYGQFAAEHMPFWIAHSPSRPGATMVRLGLIWLPRLGTDAAVLAQQYIAYTGMFADAVRAAVAEILGEHHRSMPESLVKSVIEKGISLSGSSSIRRKFYRLGTALYGGEYLERATMDTANSVRQWAAQQKQA